jgi:hypothetical protein
LPFRNISPLFVFYQKNKIFGREKVGFYEEICDFLIKPRSHGGVLF